MNSAWLDFQPGRLWSLWDIMKKFNGAIFGSYSMLVATRNKWSLESTRPQIYSPATLAILRGHAATLASAFRELQLHVFADAASGLLNEIDAAETLENGNRQFGGQNYGSALGHLNTLAEYLGLEMKGRYLLVLSPNGAKLYEPDTPLFGSDVASKFSSDAAWEIKEAGKCLGLERPTACVFHLMRTLEIALESLRICLGVPNPINRKIAVGEISSRI